MAENKDNNITSVMEALVKGAESVFTTKTVVGEATKIDDTIIIPLVDVSFGIGAGASFLPVFMSPDSCGDRDLQRTVSGL